MDITLLKEFIALSRFGSFEETADRLYTTQSTLSKHIKKMESDLGVTLFDRTTRHLQITAAGQILLSYAVQIENLEGQYLSALSSLKQLQEQSIKIGMENVSSYKIRDQKLMDIFLQFQKQHPSSKVMFSGGKMFEVYDQLLKGQIDFAIFRYRKKTDMSAFVAMPIAEDKMVAICSKHHRFASRKSVTLTELKDESFLLSTEKSFTHDYIVEACKNAGFAPNVIVSDSHVRDAIDLAALDMGIYFCTKKPVTDHLNSNVAVLDLEPPYVCKIALCYNKLRFSAASKEFWKFMSRTICEDDATP